MMIQNVCIIGSGNIGFHLGCVLVERGINVLQVWSRTHEKAILLSQRTGAQAIVDIKSLSLNADLYIIAVPDHAIASIAMQMYAILPSDVLVVHTSGATPSSILQPYFLYFGIFYPLQTFSIAKTPNFQQIPICVYASPIRFLTPLVNLASRVSEKVFFIDDSQRAQLHIAAVFVNNFTNYCYHIAAKLLEETDIPFELLQPLIQETAEKIKYFLPSEVQTGPAIRGDENTINKHLSILKEHSDWKQLYQLLSEGIKKDLGT